MWVRSQDGKTILHTTVLMLEMETLDHEYVISAYAGDGSVESAFTMGTFTKEKTAQDVMQRFCQHIESCDRTVFQI